MFVCVTLLVVLLMSFQRDFQVSGCDENCEDKPEFTPSRLVVKFGDPVSVTCSVSQHAYNDMVNFDVVFFDFLGVQKENGTMFFWTVDKMTEWGTSAVCFYTLKNTGVQCCSWLPVTIYKPPSAVSFSFVNHTGPMLEGLQYTLQCTVEDVAPVKDLNVTFYRGQTALDHLQPNKTTLTPQNETLTLDITANKEDDGVQYWCEAKLELGAEGPQPPPVVTSQTITATVHWAESPSPNSSTSSKLRHEFVMCWMISFSALV